MFSKMQMLQSPLACAVLPALDNPAARNFKKSVSATLRPVDAAAAAAVAAEELELHAAMAAPALKMHSCSSMAMLPGNGGGTNDDTEDDPVESESSFTARISASPAGMSPPRLGGAERDPRVAAQYIACEDTLTNVLRTSICMEGSAAAHADSTATELNPGTGPALACDATKMA